MRLPESEDKQLRQLLRFGEHSELLFRIFKMLNQFYVKFSELKEDESGIEPSSSC